VKERALDILSSCTPITSRTAGTNAMRVIGSSLTDSVFGDGGPRRRRSMRRCTAAPRRSPAHVDGHTAT